VLFRSQFEKREDVLVFEKIEDFLNICEGLKSPIFKWKTNGSEFCHPFRVELGSLLADEINSPKLIFSMIIERSELTCISEFKNLTNQIEILYRKTREKMNSLLSELFSGLISSINLPVFSSESIQNNPPILYSPVLEPGSVVYQQSAVFDVSFSSSLIFKPRRLPHWNRPLHDPNCTFVRFAIEIPAVVGDSITLIVIHTDLKRYSIPKSSIRFCFQTTLSIN
jgi:hypothetical protein